MTTQQFPITVDEHGYYGEFGGAFIPEMLYPNVRELKENYLTIKLINKLFTWIKIFIYELKIRSD